MKSEPIRKKNKIDAFILFLKQKSEHYVNNVALCY